MLTVPTPKGHGDPVPPPEKLKTHAHAKVNLGLKITGRLPDGYHTLHSLFLEIDLADELTFTPNESGNVGFSTSGLEIPGGGKNLCVKAAELLKREYHVPEGAHIHLEKKIPIGAGLGGGSSDAAATLKSLNVLWGLNLPDGELAKLAVNIGADVPFFIGGGLQLAENIGDELTPVDGSCLNDLTLLLVKPHFEISTSWAYAELKRYLNPEENVHNFAPISKPMNWQLFENDFERVIVSTYPEVGEIKSELLSLNAVFASLSGSGSTMYGIFDDRASAMKAAWHFASRQYWTFTARPVLN